MSGNNEKYFLSAYEKHADAIYRHCYFRVYNKELAEDLTQETFIKTWKYIAEGKEIKNIKAFLYKTAVNLIIDNSRKKKPVFLEDIGEKEKAPSIRLNSMEQKIFNSYEGKEIIKILEELGGGYKQVIIMRYIDDLRPKEIAAILGESSNAVSVRINQGLKKLRQIIIDKKHYDIEQKFS